MIKRYGMGVQSIPLGDGVSLNVPDIIEQSDGDYVRYEDHFAEVSKMVEQMEAIGAGGVSSERITQQGKAIERHRAEFVAWVTGFDGDSFFTKRRTDGIYSHFPIQRAWQAWKAARGIKE